MIIPMKKYLFLGTKKDLNFFFEEAQKKGMMQFIPAIHKEVIKPRDILDLTEAMKILKHYPVLEYVYPDGYSYQEIVETVLNLQKELTVLNEKKIEIQADILRIQPLGDFSIEEVKDIESSSENKIYFYYAKRSVCFNHDNLILINTDHEYDFYMGFSEKPLDMKELSLISVNKSLSNLKCDYIELLENIKKIEINLKKFAPFIDYLHNNLLEKINSHDLAQAKENIDSILEDNLFFVYAWVPENKKDELSNITIDSSVHFEEVRIEENDKVPTCMENKGAGKIGEDLVHIYDTPSHEDKDPSTWVLFAFCLFYAMIISDACYGLLYLMGGLFLHFKYPNAKNSFKRVIQLINLLSCFTIFWGVMACSYFSIPIHPDSMLNKISGVMALVKKKAEYHMEQKDDVYEKWIGDFSQAKNATTPIEFINVCKENGAHHERFLMQEEFSDNILLELSLLVGIIHISISFLRNIRGAYAGIGWVVSMIGGYLYFPVFLHSTSIINFLNILSKPVAQIVGFQMLVGGGVLAVVLALIQNKLKGISELLTSIQVFADILSYLRLYALGLAGMIVASTFNTMGMEKGFLPGALIIICGHIVNVTLGIMGGVIHGMRLNFLEWYHYSFQGGGRLFKPLRLLKDK